MVTITDIARRLGVAVSTVSKGLNGANDVSESTRALILKTAVEMGYAGRKVQKSGVRKVCVLAEREEFLSAGQFGYDLAMGFRTTAAQTGWQADLAPFQGLLSSQEALDTFLLRHNYAGAFLIKQPLDSFFQSNYLKNLIKKNIEYDILSDQFKDLTDKDILDQIVDLITEICSFAKKDILINGNHIPSALVKTKFLKLDSSNIQYVMEELKKGTSKIKNPHSYLISMLYNAQNTQNVHYQSAVNSDMRNIGSKIYD